MRLVACLSPGGLAGELAGGTLLCAVTFLLHCSGPGCQKGPVPPDALLRGCSLSSVLLRDRIRGLCSLNRRGVLSVCIILC